MKSSKSYDIENTQRRLDAAARGNGLRPAVIGAAHPAQGCLCGEAWHSHQIGTPFADVVSGPVNPKLAVRSSLRIGLRIDPVGKTGSLFHELERAGEVEGVVDRIQMRKVRRLSELHKGQPVARVVRVQQVAGKGQQLAAVL